MTFPGESPPLRADSVSEEYAFVTAHPPAAGSWKVESQTLGPGEGGMVDRLRARSDDGEERTFVFAVGSFFGTTGMKRHGVPTTEFLDAVMEKAEAFARETGAHHPGSIPRFPMPSDRYPGRLDVPLPILAVDAGRRGLYAPARVVTIGFNDMEPFGVGEFPGFDPDDWPPVRLGDWPPPAASTLDRIALQATISRFNGVAVRLFDAFFSGETYPQVPMERAEFVRTLATLDLPNMEPYYRKLGARFFEWLRTS